MIADTWLGAIACAPGSQTCSGMMPALNPKPTRARTKIAVATPGCKVSWFKGPKVKEPLTA